MILEKANYLNIRSANQLWKTYSDKLEVLSKARDNANVAYQNALLRSKENPEVIAQELNAVKSKLEQLKSKIETIKQLGTEYATTLVEIDKSEKLGAQLHQEIEKIQAGLCPECGAMLSEGNSKKLLADKKSQLQQCRI